jgi:gluconate 2-dehydrogenase gamma chain
MRSACTGCWWQPEVRRRTILVVGASAAVAGPLLYLARGKGAGKWRFFTSDEARAVDAICEQLIPADRDPGAKFAGVVNYIDIQLTRAFRKHRQVYRKGLAEVDSASRARFGKPFADLSSERQIEILNGAEKNSKAFFELILAHTRQGFYGDPRHGGNRQMVSWKMVGLPYPPLRGRQHYEDAKQG